MSNEKDGKNDDDDDSMDGVRQPPPSTFNPESMVDILGAMDPDIAGQVVLSAVSRDYNKVADALITASEIMYLRSMQKTLKNPVKGSKFTVSEIRDALRAQGWLVGR